MLGTGHPLGVWWARSRPHLPGTAPVCPRPPPSAPAAAAAAPAMGALRPAALALAALLGEPAAPGGSGGLGEARGDGHRGTGTAPGGMRGRTRESFRDVAGGGTGGEPGGTREKRDEREILGGHRAGAGDSRGSPGRVWEQPEAPGRTAGSPAPPGSSLGSFRVAPGTGDGVTAPTWLCVPSPLPTPAGRLAWGRAGQSIPLHFKECSEWRKSQSSREKPFLYLGAAKQPLPAPPKPEALPYGDTIWGHQGLRCESAVHSLRGIERKKSICFPLFTGAPQPSQLVLRGGVTSLLCPWVFPFFPPLLSHPI